MSAFAALTLKNNATTDVVFSPLTIDTNGVAQYGSLNAIYDGKTFVSISSKVPSVRSNKARLKLKITLPLMDAVDTSKKIDEAIASVEIAFPKNMGQSSRRDLRAYIDTLISNAVTTAFVDGFEGIY